jgi:hypothetical protein
MTALEVDYVTLFADVTEPSPTSNLREAVSLLASRTRVPPLVVLVGLSSALGEWSLERMLNAARELHASVLRPGDECGAPSGVVASVMVEAVAGYGVVGIDSQDLREAFAPPCAGFVFKWTPWFGEEAPATIPPALRRALADPQVTRLLLTYRFPPSGSLKRLDDAIGRILSTAARDLTVTVAAPVVVCGPEEAVITVIAGGRA